MDEKLTLQIQEWLDTPADDRNIAVGAELMLKLNRNRILYQNVISKGCRMMGKVEYELKKYLRMMMPDGGNFSVSYDREKTDGYRLGLMSDFSLDTSEAEDVSLDDIIHIDTDENGGIIAGSNPRSVLLAVYRFLQENGCRWLFPGIDGEFIPMQDIVAVRAAAAGNIDQHQGVFLKIRVIELSRYIIERGNFIPMLIHRFGVAGFELLEFFQCVKLEARQVIKAARNRLF